MSILHRILVSKHKRKRVYIGRKPTYKKFLGLKTFKNVIYTKLSLPYRPEVLKELAKKVIIKKPKIKARKHVKFRVLKLLAPHSRRQEVILAQRDIENFKDIKAESFEEKAPEEKFQAFLPYTVWAKMTYKQRGAHIRKRKALAIQSKFRHSGPAKYSFSNKRVRPVLTSMRFADRRRYLKGLIKFATVESHSAVIPISNQDTSAMLTRNIKAVVQAGKQLRKKKSVYKDLTYNSLLPVGAGVLY